ncbi:uncharacterized protein HMPREF1541_00424 [Cyphellophora europaea CBS 101466]|uniref:FAD/NAD(P)-binding domain-containing protein n=1 Tax=Cyphellophora europaea (strain CBS 101466) TaxID=1220924 RepID=W2SCA8_CYPE1|nr:uncharacterized protein HMPREF1541_00424 [Cyphellophora europaea CBS 101466]ETN46240.1 hypothetical protein HMPREF1541_00424 [Cyphellophora europaea CBS 101466]
MASDNAVDCLIIGAGISGINAAYRFQSRFPDSTYTILDARSELGGTWSFFKYPGLRSDSDLYTFGFPWNPWDEDREIATAPAILSYLHQSCEKFGIDRHIRYQHFVRELHWKSDLQRWQATVVKGGGADQPDSEGDGKEELTYYARYLVLGTGYYDYHTPLQTTVPGLEHFKGTIIHPQFWDTSLSTDDKKVAIIGSGATAVTLLPTLSETAEKVTMIQRSPGYFFTPPLQDWFNAQARRWLPSWISQRIMRWRMIALNLFLIQLCWWFPQRASNILKSATAQLLPKETTLTMEKDFSPTYTPMQQRLCICPGGDFFEALRRGKADIVTGPIASVEPHGVRMQDGRLVEADILVTATGLKINVGGHARVLVDGEEVNVHDKFVWKGTMVQDVPNLAIVIGYVDHPWTLGADATSRLFTRIIAAVEKRGATSVTPCLSEEEKRTVKDVPYIAINSTYLKAAREKGCFPRGGDRGPWVPRHNYLKDHWAAEWGGFGGLVFGKQSAD